MAIRISVNGRDLDVLDSDVTYEEIIKLAGVGGWPSVTYCGRRTVDVRRAGSMHPGCKAVELEVGLSFSVIHTSRA